MKVRPIYIKARDLLVLCREIDRTDSSVGFVFSQGGIVGFFYFYFFLLTYIADQVMSGNRFILFT